MGDQEAMEGFRHLEEFWVSLAIHLVLGCLEDWQWRGSDVLGSRLVGCEVLARKLDTLEYGKVERELWISLLETKAKYVGSFRGNSQVQELLSSVEFHDMET
ncbi:unnamed protein product [Victoria cruziana]